MISNLVQKYIDRVPIIVRGDAKLGFHWQVEQTLKVMGSQALVVASTHNEVRPEFVLAKLRRIDGAPTLISTDFLHPANEANLRLPELALSMMMNLSFGLSGKRLQSARMAYELTSACAEQALDKLVPCVNLAALTQWTSAVQRDALKIFSDVLLPDVDRLVDKHVRAAERFVKFA